jgi:hypothetical protein
MLRILFKFSGLIASSWALSWCLYRLHRLARKSGTSPMAPICTTAPFESGAACVLASGAQVGSGDTDCVSTSRDVPRGKAAPANLCADPAAEVWGVLYKITRRGLVRHVLRGALRGL